MTPRLASLALALVTLAFAAPVLAQLAMPGTYVTEQGRGTMVIGKPDAKGVAKLKIDAVGGNAHTCELEATLRGTRATAENKCVVEILPKDGWVQVAPTKGTAGLCREYCGARASFDGEYFVQVERCEAQAVGRQRKQFTKLYGAKDYTAASGVLKPVLDDCGRFLDMQLDAEVRNDLAVAQNRLNDKAGCIETLTPLRRTFIDEPAATFSPADEAWGKRLTSASRFNWKACGGK